MSDVEPPVHYSCAPCFKTFGLTFLLTAHTAQSRTDRIALLDGHTALPEIIIDRISTQGVHLQRNLSRSIDGRLVHASGRLRINRYITA